MLRTFLLATDMHPTSTPPRYRVRLPALILLASLAGPVLAAPEACKDGACAYLDSGASPDRRAADLVARMTLDEKAAQLGNNAPAIPRLGVPAYQYWNEGLHGVARAGYATVFPQAIGMAATFDEPLMRRIGDVVATEFRAKLRANHVPGSLAATNPGLTVWSPNINIFRDPRWGRGQETYGEDPFLTGRLGAAFIRGLQGADPAFAKTVATAKHFAVHSGPEANRHRENVTPSAHDLEDTYLPAFRMAVMDGKVQSFMCAYNAVNGVPACASQDLLARRLRGAWGFEGFVVSDCGAAADIYRGDALRFARTPEQAVTLAFSAGMDLVCGDYRNRMTTEAGPIVNAVRGGALSEATIDRALTRVFAARIRLGLFAADLPFARIAASDVDTPAHRALALEAARESMVLLKNDGILPLKAGVRTIAVIGPNADSTDALIGNYNGTPSAPVTVLAGIRARFPQARVVYAPGSSLIGDAESPVPGQLFCVDADCATPGLLAQRFASGKPEGTPLAQATDAAAAVAWANEQRNGAMRWTGYIRIDTAGTYRFRYQSETRYRIRIGDRVVVDAWKQADGAQIVPGEIALEGGKRYPISIEADQRGMRGEQRLLWTPPGDNALPALEAARNADVVVFVAGLTASLEGEELGVRIPGFDRGDRTSLDLPAPQEALLKRLHATGKPVVLVLMSGSALSVNWAARNVPAIVQAWYPGGEGGQAVAELLAGAFSPAGRLPVTLYRSADDLPAFNDYAMAGRTYRYFKGEPLYPFGHGLSYTRFDYGGAALTSRTIAAGDSVAVSVTVRNSGAVDSDEVTQLYVSKPGDAAGATLAGFVRTHVKAGQATTVTFPLDARRLSQVDAAGERKVMPGTYRIFVGGGQPDHASGAAQTLVVTGTAYDLPL
jgi:beta-glucosidase